MRLIQLDVQNLVPGKPKRLRIRYRLRPRSGPAQCRVRPAKPLMHSDNPKVCELESALNNAE